MSRQCRSLHCNDSSNFTALRLVSALQWDRAGGGAEAGLLRPDGVGHEFPGLRIVEQRAVAKDRVLVAASKSGAR